MDHNTVDFTKTFMRFGLAAWCKETGADIKGISDLYESMTDVKNWVDPEEHCNGTFGRESLANLIRGYMIDAIETLEEEKGV